MKFAKKLRRHMTHEWKSKYIVYDVLKKRLKRLSKQEDIEEEEFEHDFFAFCNEELKKINLFFKERLAIAEGFHQELRRRSEDIPDLPAEKSWLSKGFSNLRAQLNKIQRKGGRKSVIERQKYTDLKFAVSEFYYGLIQIQDYQELNQTGFRKILKKHDKILGTDRGKNWMRGFVESAEFYEKTIIRGLILETENLMIYLEHGNRQVAMKRIRVPPRHEKQSPWTTFRLGLFCGTFLVLLALIIKTCISRYLQGKTQWLLGIRLFRGWIILFFNIVLMGLNVYGWQKSGVNHVLIFEIEPRSHLTYQGVMEVGFFLCSLWSLAVLGYFYGQDYGIPPLCFPLILLLVSLVLLLNPLDFGYRTSRSWFLKRIGNCFLPLQRVRFADFWVGDQLTSLVAVFIDFEYTVCFFSNNVRYKNGHVFSLLENSDINYCRTELSGLQSIFALIPAFIRIVQCFRRFPGSQTPKMHLANAFKYSTQVLVVLTQAAMKHFKRSNQQNISVPQELFLSLWFWSLSLAFLATISWDLCIDWGLLRRKNKYLRTDLIYARRWYYYAAIILDTILRLIWLLDVSLEASDSMEMDKHDILICVTASAECFRRFLWNFFRLENEHLNNCGEFRAHRDIGVKPISTEELESPKEEEQDTKDTTSTTSQKNK